MLRTSGKSALEELLLTSSGFAINAPGFINTLTPSVQVNIGMSRVYTLVRLSLPDSADFQSWLTGTGISALVYVILCSLSPPPGKSARFREVDESQDEPRFEQARGLSPVDEAESDEKAGQPKSDVHVTILPA